MSAVMSGKAFSTMDEEDALLNEAICCSRNLEIKTDDDEEEEKVKVTEQVSPKRSNKLWCEMTSDTNSGSDLSPSNGKIDLSVSDENGSSLLANGQECDKRKAADQASLDTTDALDIQIEPTEAMLIESESVTVEPNQDAEMDSNVAESNGRKCKRVREGEDNDYYQKVPKNRRNSTSSSSTLSSTERVRKPVEYETDPAVLARRQKDIDYGKNTVGYDRYTQQIPKNERSRDHPRTPPMHLKCSRRGWDGMVKLWRKQLHFWDPKVKTDKKDEDVES